MPQAIFPKEGYPRVDAERKKCDVFVMHCSDHRYQDAYQWAIKIIGSKHDPIGFPGASDAIVNNETVLPAIEFLENRHGFSEVHILDHMGCGAFDGAEDEEAAHRESLKKAAEKIQAVSSLAVYGYLFTPTEVVTVEL